MTWDRFDIVEAWYLALCHCHGGQWSDDYARLCKVEGYFTPGPSLSVDSLNPNSLEIYDKACESLLAKTTRESA